ncbi:MAG: hypothetical protein RIR62_3157 [Pseudomonadota bacterium]|jgi:hypothetical protein
MATLATAGASAGPVPAPQTDDTASMMLAVLRYELSATDVAARLTRSRATRRRRWQALVSAGFASILALNFLTGKLPVPDSTLLELIELALILCGPAAFALWQVQRATAAEASEALPAPVPVTLTVHSDHAIEDRPDLPRPRRHAARTARRVAVTRHHLVLEGDAADLIIPARAFASRNCMRLLAEEWSKRIR